MKTYLLLAVLFVGINVYGQQSGITLSKPLTGKEPSLLGKIKDTYYFIEYSDDNALHIITMDEKLSPVEKKFPITSPTGKPQASKCILLGDNIYYFKLLSNKGEFSLYSWKISTADMNMGAANEVFSVAAESHISVNLVKNYANNLMYINYTPYDKSMTAYVASHSVSTLYDSELAQQWTKKIDFDKPREILFDEGSSFSYIYILRRFEEDGVWFNDYSVQQGNASLKLNPDKYFVETTSSDGENLLKIELPFNKDKLFNSMDINIMGDTIICAGFYGVDNNIQPSGIFKIAYDKGTGEMLSDVYEPFSNTFLAKLKDYDVSMNDNGLKNFRDMKIYFCSNGDVIYSAQESFGGINGNVIVLYMDSEGETKYEKAIRVKQATPVGAAYETLKLYSQNNQGYNGVVNGTTLTLFMNDNIENADNAAEDKPEQLWKKDAGAFAFQITSDGKIKRERIGGDDYFFKLGSVTQSGSEVLLELIKGEAKTESYKFVLLK